MTDGSKRLREREVWYASVLEQLAEREAAENARRQECQGARTGVDSRTLTAVSRLGGKDHRGRVATNLLFPELRAGGRRLALSRTALSLSVDRAPAMARKGWAGGGAKAAPPIGARRCELSVLEPEVIVSL